MEKMQNYRIEKLGKKAERRNYSKVSEMCIRDRTSAGHFEIVHPHRLDHQGDLG